MNNVLIRKGHHMGPMHSVLKRYGIGTVDKYDRGLWISEKDLEKIKQKMLEDESLIERLWNGVNYIFVKGTCIHNHVGFHDFEELFE